MADDPRKEMAKVVAARKRALTPEQREYQEAVTARNRAMQEGGVPAPASGTFGARPKGGK
jgi:Spy/CpxP family protein refolding chaperone